MAPGAATGLPGAAQRRSAAARGCSVWSGEGGADRGRRGTLVEKPGKNREKLRENRGKIGKNWGELGEKLGENWENGCVYKDTTLGVSPVKSWIWGLILRFEHQKWI